MSVRHALRRVAAVAGTAVVVAVVPVTSASAAPGTITGVTPTAAVNTATVEITFTTEHAFLMAPTEPTVRFTRVGAATDSHVIPAAAVETDPTAPGKKFIVAANLTRWNPGQWGITVSGDIANPATPPNPPNVSETDSCSPCFTIVGYAPVLASVSPGTIGQGATASVVIKGANFTDTAYCTSTAANCQNQPRLFVVPDTGLAFTDNTAPNSTGDQMTRAVSVAGDAPTGPRDVYVVNTDGKTAKCTACLTIAPAPTLSPNSFGPGMTSARNVVVTGEGFAAGSVAKIVATTGTTQDSNITHGATTRNSATQLTLPLTVGANATSGPRGLTIESGGGWQSFPNTFTVTNKPVVSGIAYPSNTTFVGYGTGAQSRVVRLTGTDFQPGATVAFAPATGITTVGQPTVTPTQIDVTVSIASNATANTRDVVVTNPDGGVSATTSSPDLTIVPGPTISDVIPRSLARGATNTVTIKGSNFTTANNDVTVSVAGATVGTPVVASTSEIFVPVTVPADAPVGSALVTVVNNDNKGQATYTGFTVTNMHVASVSPTTVSNEAQTVTVTGSGFAPDATVTLVRNDFASIEATANTVNPGGTAIEATLPLNLAAPGAWNVRVDNPTTNPGTGLCGCQLTVVAPAATFGTIEPAGLGHGADNEKIEITGSGFTPGMTVEFDDNARIVIDHEKTIMTPTKITIFVDVVGTFPSTENHTVEMDKVRLKTANGSYVMKINDVTQEPEVDAKDFDVFKPPAVTTPSGTILARSQGSTGGTFMLRVKDVPATGAKILVSGEGVTVGTTTFAAKESPELDDRLTASNITIAANAAPGTREIYIRNPDGGRVRCACTLLVSSPPMLTGVNPAKGARGSTVSFTASGSGFQGGATVTIGTAVATGVIVTSPTALSGQVSLPVNMATGTHDVVVTNPDNGKATKVGAFTVFTLPSAPTGVTAQRGNGSATVSWTPGPDGGDPITGYTITSNPVTAPVTASGSATSVAFPGLTNGTSYTFTVVATNGAGNSPASAPSAPVVPATVPAAPTNVTATASDASATVSWTASTANGGTPITGYKVTSSPGGKTATVGADATQAVVTDLTNDTAYTFTVVALNDVGESTASEPSAAVTPKTVMLAPTNVVATRGDGTATVTWTPASANGGTPITGYVVTSAPDGKTSEVGPTDTTATVTGLSNGTSYTFTVAAVNAAGDRAESAPSNAVTPAGIPLAPATVTATAGHGAALVRWTAANANGSPVTSYTVTVSPGGDTKTVSGASTSTTIGDLTNGTLYTFTVKATNAIGTGPTATSNAVRPTWVTTLTETATSKVVSGGISTVRGRLSRSDGRPLAGAPVQIYRRVSPTLTYSVVRTVTTASDGTWSASFTVTKNTRFRAFFAGATGYDEATSPTRLTAAAYKVTGTYSISGRTVTVKGTVSPSAAGRTVYLRHRRADGSVVNIKSGTVTSRGTYTLTRTLSRGTYYLYVYIGGTTANVAGRTPIRTTRIS